MSKTTTPSLPQTTTTSKIHNNERHVSLSQGDHKQQKNLKFKACKRFLTPPFVSYLYPNSVVRTYCILIF